MTTKTSTKEDVKIYNKEISDSKVTLIENGILVSRLINSKLLYVELDNEALISQLSFYMSIEDDYFKRFAMPIHKYINDFNNE